MSVKQPAPFWQQRAKGVCGADRKYKTPEALWKVAEQYFKWCDEHPLYKDHVIGFEGVATHVPVAKLRAYTVYGLSIFVNLTVASYNAHRDRDGFRDVCELIDHIIREQKFTGAAADLLNPNIIARDIGLADRTEVTGRDGGPMEHQVNEDAERFTSAIAGIAARQAKKSRAGEAARSGESKPSK